MLAPITAIFTRMLRSLLCRGHLSIAIFTVAEMEVCTGIIRPVLGNETQVRRGILRPKPLAPSWNNMRLAGAWVSNGLRISARVAVFLILPAASAISAVADTLVEEAVTDSWLQRQN